MQPTCSKKRVTFAVESRSFVDFEKKTAMNVYTNMWLAKNDIGPKSVDPIHISYAHGSHIDRVVRRPG